MPGERFRIALPKEARRGEPVEAVEFNKLRTAVKVLADMLVARTPQPSADVGFKFLPGGFTAFLKRRGGGGGGGSGGTRTPPLYLTSARPGHIAAPEEGPGAGYRRFWWTMGHVNGIRMSNFDDPVDLPEDQDRWVMLQVTLPSTNSLTIAEAEWVVGSGESEYATPDWPNNGTRPGTAFKLMATWHENLLVNSGAGNLQMTEVVSDIRMGASMGESLLIKQFFWNRESYL